LKANARSLGLVAAAGLALLTQRHAIGNCDSALGPDAIYPLAVGSTWTYRCSAEGEFQFEKTLTAVSELEAGETTLFEMKLDAGGSRPLTFYLFHDARGDVFRTLKSDGGEAEIVVTADPKAGDRIGNRIAAGIETIDTPALNDVAVIRIESFAFEESASDTSQQSHEWRAEYFAHGVGLVMEADGLGGDCVLSHYKLAAAPR
jgi:hypothetical protein